MWLFGAIAAFKDENEMALSSDAWDPFNERNTLVETSKDVADKALNFLNPYRLVVIMNEKAKSKFHSEK